MHKPSNDLDFMLKCIHSFLGKFVQQSNKFRDFYLHATATKRTAKHLKREDKFIQAECQTTYDKIYVFSTLKQLCLGHVQTVEVCHQKGLIRGEIVVLEDKIKSVICKFRQISAGQLFMLYTNINIIGMIKNLSDTALFHCDRRPLTTWSIRGHSTFSLITPNFGIGQSFACRFGNPIAYNTMATLY